MASHDLTTENKNTKCSLGCQSTFFSWGEGRRRLHLINGYRAPDKTNKKILCHARSLETFQVLFCLFLWLLILCLFWIKLPKPLTSWDLRNSNVLSVIGRQDSDSIITISFGSPCRNLTDVSEENRSKQTKAIKRWCCRSCLQMYKREELARSFLQPLSRGDNVKWNDKKMRFGVPAGSY